MIGEIRLKQLYQREATTTFSKTLCICAPLRHDVIMAMITGSVKSDVFTSPSCFILIGQKMREAAGSRVFPLFSSCFVVPPPGQVKTFLLKKYTLARKQAFI